MFSPSRGHALNRHHLGALGLEGGENTGIDAVPVDDHRAGAALGLVAADLGAGQPQVIAQHLSQKAAGRDVERVRCTVDGDV